MYSIVIPAYNEEKRIGKTLECYTNFLAKKKLKYEIIVVCDGCTDKSTNVVKKFQKHNKKIKLFILPHRLGKGGGVYHGFSKCNGNIIGFTDADNAVRPEESMKLLDNIKNADCIIASRRMKNSLMIIPPKSGLWNFSMRLLSRIFNKIVNFLFMLNIKDTQCGAKFMKREVYKSIKNELKISGFEFDVELLWRIKEHGYKIKEIGIIWRHDLESKSSVLNSLNMLISLLKRKYWDHYERRYSSS